MKKIFPVFLLIILVSCNEKQGITSVEEPAVFSDSQTGEAVADNSDSEDISESEPISEDRTEVEVSPDESSAETAQAETDVQEDIMDGYKMITWWDLLSKAEFTYYEEEYAAYDADPSYSPTSDPPAPGINPDISGMKVCIPGFVVGVDSDPDNFSMVNTFLFVPYQGACIHVPPPPSNQTIFATVDKPFQSNPYTPYWLFGTIYTEEGDNDIAAYSYAFKGEKLKIYQ